MSLWHWAACFVWWAIGSAGFVWAWTRRYDFTTSQAFTALYSGAMGPFAWLMGYCMFIREPWNIVLLKRGDRTNN